MLHLTSSALYSLVHHTIRPYRFASRCVGIAFILLVSALRAQNYTFTTLAGFPGETNHVDGVGSDARFTAPMGVALSPLGDVYVADSHGGRIRKVSPLGAVSTFASLGIVQGVAVDTAGNVYASDTQSHLIYKVSPVGVVSILAGSPNESGNADGVGSSARFYAPRGLAADRAGNVYVADSDNSLIRKIAPNGTVSTVAGLRGSSGSVDGPLAVASFNRPTAVAIGEAGQVYVTDSGNHTIRQISTTGMITTLAGMSGQSGSADGTGSNARFNNPWGIAVDAQGTLFVGDYDNGTVRRITAGGAVTTIGGQAGKTGSSDGPGATARFFRPAGIAVNGSGTLYVADSFNNFTLRVGYPAGADTLPIFVVHPEQQTATLRQRAVFRVTTTAQPQSTLQWQRSVDKGLTWSNVAETATYTGGTTAVLTVSGVDAGMSGTLFRCIATNLIGQVASRSALLVVNLAYEFTTLAGDPDATGSTNGTGSAAQFDWPMGVAADSNGNVYVADTSNHTIRKISSAGVTSTLAGTPGQAGAVDGTGAAARFETPTAVVVDPAGNVYVADGGNHSIRKITSAGVVTTLAGGLSRELFGHVDARGSAARFYFPSSIALDRLGNLFVVDWSQHTVRKIDPQGNVTTFAGRPFLGTTTGNGSNVDLSSPSSVAVDAASNVYVVDGLGEVVKIEPEGSKKVIAGRNGNGGPVDGPGDVARFTFPYGLAVDRAGNLFVTDGSNLIRWISAAGVVTTIGGSEPTTLDNRTNVDGVGTLSRFNRPHGIAVDSDGTLYVADRANSTVRVGRLTGGAVAPTIVKAPVDVSTPARHDVTFGVGFVGVPLPACRWQGSFNGGTSWADLIDNATFVGTGIGQLTIRNPTPALDGAQFRCVVTNEQGSAASAAAELIVRPEQGIYMLTSFAGTPGFFGRSDGAIGEAKLREPRGLAAAPGGIVYVADANHTIRKITSAGIVSTFAGAVNEPGSTDGSGGAARFREPHGLAVDRAGNVYVADSGNHTIRKITPAGTVTTLAGQPEQFGSSDGNGAAARFFDPADVAVDANGNVFVADLSNLLIRRITPTGVVTTVAGSPGQTGYVNGTGAAARFNRPHALAIDAAGTLYVADSSNLLIRKVTAAGVVTTLAGRFNVGGHADGSASQAVFMLPDSIAVDAVGNVFVGESQSHVVRRISPEGNVTTVLGSPYEPGSSHGVGNVTRLSSPSAIDVDSAGTLYIADRGNHVIRRATSAAAPSLAITRTHLSPMRGGSASFDADWSGTGPLTYAWEINGVDQSGGTHATLSLSDVQPSRTGLYRVSATNVAGTSVSQPNILGLLTSDKVVGAGEEFQADILHPTGRTFDQLLLKGAAASFTADPGQVTRLSFVDLNNDIVQVEFSGPGTVSLVLDGSSGPARPVNYTQAVDYVKGHAGLVVAGATEQTNLSVFTVGRANAYNQSIFRDNVSYDGVADIAFVAILSLDGKFGGLRTANAAYWAMRGVAGVYAPGVQFTGPVFVGDITAFDEAEPFLVIGGSPDTRITGGDLFQSNARPVQVRGLTQLKFMNGSTSHGATLTARPNNSVLKENGDDVTGAIVVNPAR